MADDATVDLLHMSIEMVKTGGGNFGAAVEAKDYSKYGKLTCIE